MRQQANKKRRDIQFQIGDLVLVKLQPYRQATVAKRLHSKLCKRYFGPFPIKAHVGQVAYTLELPEGSRIHPTFHVSVLKPFYGPTPPTCYPLPELVVNNKPVMIPQAIISTREHKGERQVLVQWSLSAPEDATWETLSEFGKLYDISNLKDKVVVEEGGSVGPIQLTSPIHLDPSKIQERVKGWIEGSDQREVEDSNEQSTSTQKEDPRQTMEEERVQARGTRVRVRPKWLQEFVRMERS
ncbi:uncharacterized protein LOC133779947 [Humulus lupulus]|uniref:uncharacterized protein LOC133779947 n=1 Tax=Humulus lupulus TaxID=3486 RepID=UPI002B4029E4|nr:uncharacterized protein LOC133779947 [Humulus lupulus]